MTARAIMFMGTGSDVGKSLIVAGLCRLFANRGIKVAPFKPQNMSNNAAAVEGGEIGRAQALQARAARLLPNIHMNPVLLKPEAERGAQIIVQGQRAATLSASDFFRGRQKFMPAINESFALLSSSHDLILVEGAGSPAEINLRNGDLANMGFAKAQDLPVVLIGDIHRGGVIASLVGTKTVLNEADNKQIKAFIINKFHGDPNLFDDGLVAIRQRTNWPCLGVVPHFASAHRLPAEDALALDADRPRRKGKLKIAVLRLPRIANFDDLDPLLQEPDVRLDFIEPTQAIPGDCHLVIIPGSKSTIADLAALRGCGWDIDIAAHVRRGGHVLGLCGGFQILGRKIHDPLHLESTTPTIDGLGLLDVETTMSGEKTVSPVVAKHVASGEDMSGYEIHLGKTSGPGCAHPFSNTPHGPDGAVNGTVMGTYLHGCFASDGFRGAFLKALGGEGSNLNYEATVDRTLDDLANHLEQHLDIAAILRLAGIPSVIEGMA